MLEEKLKKILSFNGLSVIIGILGSLASILTVFVTQWDSKINIKWLIFVLFISITLILILMKLIYELNNDLRSKTVNSSTVVRYIPDSTTFLVKKNELLGYSAMVSIFYIDNSFEVELAKGYVKNIQEHFIQIQIISISEDFREKKQDVLELIENNNITTLQQIVVKNYVTYTN